MAATKRVHRLLVGPPLFDPSILARLAAQASGHGDTSLVRELVEDALASIAHCAGELESAVRAGDLARIRAQAHRIKSVLRQVGALRMGEEAARAEALAHGGDVAAFEHARAALASRSDTEHALREHLARLPGPAR